MEDLGSGDSPSLGKISFAVCHGCLSSQLLRQVSSAGYKDPTLNLESLPPLLLVKNSGGFHSPNLGFNQGLAPSCLLHPELLCLPPLLPRPQLAHGSPLLQSGLLAALHSSTSVAAVTAVAAPQYAVLSSACSTKNKQGGHLEISVLLGLILQP